VVEVYISGRNLEIYDRNGVAATPAILKALGRWGIRVDVVLSSPCG
jgi:hypothetical protein